MAKILLQEESDQEEIVSMSGSDYDNDEFDEVELEDEIVTEDEEVEENDKVEVDNESIADDDSEDEGSDDENVSNSDEDMPVKQPPQKKAKKVFNPTALASAFQTVLRQTLPSEVNTEASSTDKKNNTSKTGVTTAPILSRRKAVEQDIDEEGIDRRARQILKAQIREAQESIHNTEASAPESLNFERSLRKLATRGVVQLFNAIHLHQQKKDEAQRDRAKEKLIKAQQSLPLVGNSIVDSTKEGTVTADSSTSSTEKKQHSFLDFLKKSQSNAGNK